MQNKKIPCKISRQWVWLKDEIAWTFNRRMMADLRYPGHEFSWTDDEEFDWNRRIATDEKEVIIYLTVYIYVGLELKLKFGSLLPAPFPYLSNRSSSLTGFHGRSCATRMICHVALQFGQWNISNNQNKKREKNNQKNLKSTQGGAGERESELLPSILDKCMLD